MQAVEKFGDEMEEGLELAQMEAVEFDRRVDLQ